jgi:hypothetical protein
MDWLRVQDTMSQMDRALLDLVLGGHAEAAALVELHRAKDALAAVCAEQRATPPAEIEPDVPHPPFGYDEWRDLTLLSTCVVANSDELGLWRDVGAAVGQCQYLLWSAPTVGPYPKNPPHPASLPDLIGRLTEYGRYGFLLDLPTSAGTSSAPAAPTLAGWWERVQGSYLDASRLDAELHAALRQDAPPEPVLVLDKDYITSFGERWAVHDCAEAEVGCLWVLAECAGQDVARDTIIEEACLSKDRLNLKSHVSRLRNNVLKPLAEKGCGRSQRPLHPAHQHGYITGTRGPEHSHGPYRLDLDPALVRVTLPRPAWMCRQP